MRKGIYSAKSTSCIVNLRRMMRPGRALSACRAGYSAWLRRPAINSLEQLASSNRQAGCPYRQHRMRIKAAPAAAMLAGKMAQVISLRILAQQTKSSC